MDTNDERLVFVSSVLVIELHREIMQLNPEARRILLTLALLSEASLAELAEVTGYDAARVAAATLNLSSLFLVEAPKLGSENRIRVSETTGRLVLSIRRELAADHIRIERTINHFRASAQGGQQPAANKSIGAAILQASALERQGKFPEALETLNHAIRKASKGKRGDLLAYVGYLHSKKSPPEFELSRRACREAFNEGCFKPRLFETWFSAEWEIGNYPGTEEVARVALERLVEPIYEWRIRLAAALSSKAHAQSGGRVSLSVLPAYLDASNELSEAIRLAPSGEAHKFRSNLEDTNDLIYRASLDAVVTPLDRLAVIRHITAFIQHGDLRIRNYARILGLVEELFTHSGSKSKSNRDHLYAAQSCFLDVRKLINQRIERFPDDERHCALVERCRILDSRLFELDAPEISEQSAPGIAKTQDQVEKILPGSRQEQALDGVVVSSISLEIVRPALPNRLSVLKDSPHYVSECHKFRIGIRLNGKDRVDVTEYCIDEGWVRVPSKKTVDRKGKPLLIVLKGTVEPFYRD